MPPVQSTDSTINRPSNKNTANSVTATKNNILAISAAPTAIPVKPNIPATIEISANIKAHLSIGISFTGDQIIPAGRIMKSQYFQIPSVPSVSTVGNI